MCGIAGIVSRTPFQATEGEACVSPMTDSLSHRGPDDRANWSSDFVALGHTRLSIIDLSARGRQPMADASGRYQIIYNGEIYNYIELRHTLESLGHVFQTATDTEVLLHAYMQWGEQALNRLNGMWALAIWDAERRELFAARDRSGKKPFYYACTEDRLYFASEVKALRAVGLRFGVNAQAAFDFLTQGTYGHLHAQTFFSGVLQLPAAHYMVVRPGQRPTPRRYWDLPVVPARDRVPYDSQFQRRFRDLLTD